MRSLRILVVLVISVCSGCVKVDQDLIINEEGSGSFSLTYSVSETTVQQVEAMHKLQKDLDQAAGRVTTAPQGTDFTRLLFNPIVDEVRAKLKEYEKIGVSIEKLEVKNRDARRNVEIKLQFDSLAKVANTDFFKQFGFSMTKDAKGNYVIDRPPQVSELPEGIRYDDPQVVKILAPLLEGFSVTVSVRTPGRILSTSATSRGPFTAAWRYEFDRNPTALTDLLTQHFSVVFDGKGFNLPEIRPLSAPAPGVGAKINPASK